MHRVPIDSRKNRVKGLQQVTTAEMARIHRNARLVHIPGKGQGVVARRDLPRRSLVGSLIGPVYTDNKWDRMVRAKQITGHYGMSLGGGKMVDLEVPMSSAGPPVFYPDHQAAFGFMFNEPGVNESVNGVFVHNYNLPDGMIAPRVDVYTHKRIPKGQEIMCHYGDTFADNRDYAAPQDARPQPLRIVPGRSGRNVFEDAS